jgi:hypothetical protein
MMKNTIIIICASFLSMTGRAQINLVLNPDFEQYNTCPSNPDEAKYCSHWMSLDSAWNPPDWAHDLPGVPEYCNVCAPLGDASVPAATAFYHYPRSGNGMMQVQMFSNDLSSSYIRDYLQGHLSRTLIAGHKYNVKFYTVLEHGGGYAVNGVAAYIDNGAIDTTNNPGLIQNQYTPQIEDTNIIRDTLNWTKVEDTFTANGTEKLITIGQFRLNSNTRYNVVTWGTATSWAWYLIDDVSVIDCSNVPFAGHDTTIRYAGDSVFLGSHETLLPYTWYIKDSTNAIDSGGGIWVKPTHTTTYVLQQKLCGITKFDTVKVRVWPDTVNSVGSWHLAVSNVQLYPNPSTGALTIEHARNCDIAFYDITGRAVLQSAITTDKATFDISPLAKGLYMVQVVDRSTGERVIRKVLKE